MKAGFEIMNVHSIMPYILHHFLLTLQEPYSRVSKMGDLIFFMKKHFAYLENLNSIVFSTCQSSSIKFEKFLESIGLSIICKKKVSKEGFLENSINKVSTEKLYS